MDECDLHQGAVAIVAHGLSWVARVLDIAPIVFGTNSKTQLEFAIVAISDRRERILKMLRKFFQRYVRLVEVVGPGSRRQVMTHNEYISKTIADRRAEAELLRLGLSVRREPDYLVEHVMRRWMS